MVISVILVKFYNFNCYSHSVLVLQHQENSLDELRSLSDAWEFQETEIMKARDKLRSIRAKLTVIDGKLSLEIRFAIQSLASNLY